MPAQMRKPKAKSKKSKVKKSKPKPKSRLDLDGKLVKFISKIVNETLDKREAQQAQDMSKIFQEEVQQVEKNMKELLETPNVICEYCGAIDPDTEEKDGEIRCQNCNGVLTKKSFVDTDEN